MSRAVDVEEVASAPDVYSTVVNSNNTVTTKLEDDTLGTIPEAPTTTNQTNIDEVFVDSSTNFVDFTPPPAVKILPPAKYKLWLLVYCLVYLASWLTYEVQMLKVLTFNGRIAPDGALFLQFGLIVVVMVYSTVDLVLALLTFRTKDGKVYGMEAFMKAPRSHWVYKHDNFIFQILARIVSILEDGFAMFDAPPTQYKFTSPAPSHHHTAAEHHHNNHHLHNLHQHDMPFECAHPNNEKILKIEHRILKDKLEEYKKWQIKVFSALSHFHGITILSRTLIQPESSLIEQDDVEGGHTTDSFMRMQREAHDHVQTSNTSDSNSDDNDDDDDALYQSILVKFVNLEALNDWMQNPRRKVLMKALQPMLAVPSVIKIHRERVLPDAFSDLLVRQGGGKGGGATSRPPKKWKVWWVTVLALFLTTKWTSTFLPSYLVAWGLANADHRIQRLITVAIVTFLNSYITSPLILFFFDYWLNHHVSDRKHHNIKEPWKTFDNGLQSIWSKLLVSIAFFGGCLIGAIIKNR